MHVHRLNKIHGFCIFFQGTVFHMSKNAADSQYLLKILWSHKFFLFDCGDFFRKNMPYTWDITSELGSGWGSAQSQISNFRASARQLTTALAA